MSKGEAEILHLTGEERLTYIRGRDAVAEFGLAPATMRITCESAGRSVADPFQAKAWPFHPAKLSMNGAINASKPTPMHNHPSKKLDHIRSEFDELRSDLAKIADDLAKIAADLAKIAGDIAKIAGDLAKIAADIAKVWPRLDRIRVHLATPRQSLARITSGRATNRAGLSRFAFEWGKL